MDPLRLNRLIRSAQAWALVGLPGTMLLVFVMHFQTLARFFDIRLHYVPRAPSDVVRGLMALGGHRPWIHDPHVLAYLALPLFMLAAFGLYALGKSQRPTIAVAGLALTATGAIYTGGNFGMWAALYGGLSRVDPQYIDGAIATFAAQTAPQGAFLLTTTLSKLALVGLVVQLLALWGTRVVRQWSIVVAATGCGLIVAFWDLDNWMLVGAALMLVAFASISGAVERLARRPSDAEGA